LWSLYHNGDGIKQDRAKAFMYLKKSAQLGYVDGLFKLGVLYDEGIVVEHDEKKIL
jgi:TPR repeat protein